MIGVAFKGDETIIKSDQHVYQWDTGQKIMVSGLGNSSINQVHFSFNGLKTAYPVNVTNSSGTITVNIPNIVLRYGKDVYMYLCIKNTNGTVVTIKTVIIPVIKRNMPENYMYDDNETVAVKLDELQTEIHRSTAVDTEHENRITTLEEAKTNAEGKEFETLKERIDNDFNVLNNDLIDESNNRKSAITVAVNEEKERAISRENEIETLFSAPVEESVNNWLNEHPEVTTTVQPGTITSDKLHESVKAKTGYYFYNVTDYGILPDTGDVYSALYDLMAEKVRYTGGIVYFPKGLYTLSNTIFIPENTTFCGDGEDTEIYFDETNVNFGTGLSNAGSNVTIRNIKVTQKSTGVFQKGSAPGCIGFSDITINQYDLPKDTTELSRGYVKNLTAENVYFGESNYPIQTEPSVDYSIHNVIYRNLVGENGCVSLMVCGEGSTESTDNVIVENVICDLIRVEERAMRHIGNVSVRNVICNNFYLNANKDSTGMITVDNMSQTGNVCNNVYSSGLINGNITLRGCTFKNNESKTTGIDVGAGIHYFYNCIFDMYMKVFTRLISLSDSDYMHIENCSIKLSGATSSSILVGYGRNNIYYDADSKIKNLLFGDCYAELKSIGAQAVTAKHNNTINIRDDNLYISVHAQMTDNSAVFTLSDKAKALPIVGVNIPVIIYNNSDRTGTQVNTYAKIENGVLKIQEPGYETGNGYDRILIHAPLELTRKPTPLEIYTAFG